MNKVINNLLKIKIINRIASAYYKHAYVYFSICPPQHKINYYITTPIILRIKDLKEKKGSAR